MKEIMIHISGGIVPEKKKVTIHIEVPLLKKGKEAAPVLEKDGRELADAILESVPSGTYDTMMRILLHQEIENYKFRKGSKEEVEDARQRAVALRAARDVFVERTDEMAKGY